jgi:hypothetical protein
MNLGDLIQRVSLKLGEQTTFYPEEEIVANGLNPAQRLLCLTYPFLLQKRVLLSIYPEQVFTDLRSITPTIRKLNRVVLGDVFAPLGSPVSATGELKRLHVTTINRLAGLNDWMRQTGTTTKYWMFGPYWFGLWKRPMTTLSVTLLYDAMPTQLTLSALTAIPDVDQVYHPLLADIATGLLLCKEGDPESGRGVTMIREALKSV